MNIDYEIINNKVIVHTDGRYGFRFTREVTNNIEDILICENNIEEMEERLQYYLDKTKQAKKKIKSSWLNLAVSILWFINFSLNSLIGKWWLSIIQLIASISYGINYYLNVKNELKLIKASKPVIKELEDSLKIEKEKLNELNKDKTNDLMYITPSKKTLDKSEQIKNLKRKLDVIYSFEIHKNKLINYYKKGVLREKALTKFWFDNDDYYLLEELIKNELSKNNEKKIGNQKVLKRK